MGHAIKYMIDAKGEKASVVVPLKTREKMNDHCIKLQRKSKIFTNIQSGLNEINKTKKSRKRLQTLKEFLHEGNG